MISRFNAPIVLEKLAGKGKVVVATVASTSRGRSKRNVKAKIEEVVVVPEIEEPEEDEEEDDDDDDESEDESDGEPIVYMLDNREKRSNAGNRMRALLEEEVELEEAFAEEVDDEEFEAKDEDDVFDSDFGSTDEEAGGEEDDEKRIEREAKAEAREARGKKKKTSHTPFLPTFAKQTKQARNAIASTSAATLDGPSPRKRKRGINNPANFGVISRESSRKSAVDFKKGMETRLKESEKKRATHIRPARKIAVSLTQGDLIAEALETEEINRASLLAFYAAEEDRRMADRIAGMRYEIVGPKLTFLSRLEGVERKESKGKGKIGEEVMGSKTAAEKLESGRRRLIEVIGEAGKAGWRPNSGMGDPAPSPSTSASTSTSTSKAVVPSTLTNGSTPSAIASTSVSTSTTTSRKSNSNTTQHPFPSASLDPASSTIGTVTPIPGAHTRNYLILDGFEGTKEEEMTAFFGNHHEWGSVKIVPTRSRVLQRQVPTCVITGLPAPYRDPRTQSPYATISAYNTLSSILTQSYAWNETIGAYTGEIGVGLEAEFENTLNGKKLTGVSVMNGWTTVGGGSGGGGNNFSSVTSKNILSSLYNNNTSTSSTSNQGISKPNSNSSLASVPSTSTTITGQPQFVAPPIRRGRGKAKAKFPIAGDSSLSTSTSTSKSLSTSKTPASSGGGAAAVVAVVDNSNPYSMTWNGESKGGREARARGRESFDASSIPIPKLENLSNGMGGGGGGGGGGVVMSRKISIGAGSSRSRSRSKSLAAATTTTTTTTTSVVVEVEAGVEGEVGVRGDKDVEMK